MNENYATECCAELDQWLLNHPGTIVHTELIRKKMRFIQEQRQSRDHVTFIDGLPIIDAILDAGPKV